MKKMKCKHCGEYTEVSRWTELNRPHLFGKKIYAKCPHCGKRSWLAADSKKDIKNG